MSIDLHSLTMSQLVDLGHEYAERLGLTAPNTYHTKDKAIERVQGFISQWDAQSQATIDDPGMSSALSELDEDEVEEKVSSDRNAWRGKSMAERAAHRGWSNVELFEKYREHKRASRKMKREGIAGWEHEHAEALRLKRLDRAAAKK